jgi:hypothetical protein
MALTIPYSFTNATIAEAGEVNSNNTAIKSFVDALQAGTNITAGAITAASIANDRWQTHSCNSWFIHNGRYYGGCAGSVNSSCYRHRCAYWRQRPDCYSSTGVWIMQAWTNPIINALQTTDAVALQQIFASLSQEFGRLNKEIEQLKIENSKNSRKDYQRIK